VPIPDSSHISSIIYDDESMILYVEFQRGAIYAYMNVPGDIVTGFTQALSAGQYFNQFVRDAGFDFQRLA
jgi:hypothetical protein